MELLKDPKTLQRAVSLVTKPTQSARSALLVKQAQSARDLLGTAGMKPKDLKSALRTGIAALMTPGGEAYQQQDQSKTVRFSLPKHVCLQLQ